MSKKLSRQRIWQIHNPEKDRIIREQVKLNHKRELLKLGIVKSQEEIHDIIRGYEWRWVTRLTGEQWWDTFEYLDWKYNGSKFTDLKFSRRLERI